MNITSASGSDEIGGLARRRGLGSVSHVDQIGPNRVRGPLDGSSLLPRGQLGGRLGRWRAVLLVLLGLAAILVTALVIIAIAAARRTSTAKAPTNDGLAIKIIEQRRASEHLAEDRVTQRG